MRRKTNAGGIYDRILSTYNASDIFTDREAPREAFWNEYGKLRAELTDPDSDDTPPHILLYYGISGIGKTRLLTEIGRELDRKKDETGSKSSYRWVMYDFTDFGNTKEDVIKGLAHLLSQKYGFKFPMTALAETKIADEIGRKPDMEMPTIEDKIRSSKIGNTILNVIKFTPFGDIAENIFDGIQTIEDLFDIRFLEKLNPWFMLPLGKSLVDYFHHADLRNVRGSLEAAFSFDLDNNLEKTPDEPLVIMLDTYERYTHIDDDTPTRGYVKDLWLRRHDGVIASVPGILWVIAGREKLGEIEKTESPDSWNALGIKEHLVGNLAPNDIRSYLSEVGITDTVLQDHLIELTGGVPLLLDMARETFVSLSGDPIKQRDPALYGHNKEELVVRALDNMGSAFAKLSTSFSLIDGGWTDNMIAEIHGSLPGWDDEIYAQMKRHSMVKYDSETSQYSMHPVIKDILSTRNGIMQHTRDEINEAVFGYRVHTGSLDTLSGSDTVSLIRLSFSNKTFAEPFFDEHMLDVILSHIASGDEDYLDTVFDTYETALRNREEEWNGLRNKLILSDASAKLANGYSKEMIERARKAYDYILKHYDKTSPAIRDAAMVYGSVLLYTGQYIAARNTFSHLLKDNADSDTPFFIQYGLGRAELEFREYDSALEAADKAYTAAMSSGNQEEMAEAEILKISVLAHSNRAENATEIIGKLWEKRGSFTLAMLGDAYAATIYAAAVASDDERTNEYYDSLVQDIRNPAVLPVNTQRNILEAFIKAKPYIDDNGLTFRIEELYTLITERHGYMNAASLKSSIAYVGYISTGEKEKSRKLLEDILGPARLIFGKDSLEVADILSLLSTVIPYKERDYIEEIRREAAAIRSSHSESLTTDEYEDRFYDALSRHSFNETLSALIGVYATDEYGHARTYLLDSLYYAISEYEADERNNASETCDIYDKEEDNFPNDYMEDYQNEFQESANYKKEIALIISGISDTVMSELKREEISRRIRRYIEVRKDLENSSIAKYTREVALAHDYTQLESLITAAKHANRGREAIDGIIGVIAESRTRDDIQALIDLLDKDDYRTALKDSLDKDNTIAVKVLLKDGASPEGLSLLSFMRLPAMEDAEMTIEDLVRIVEDGAVIWDKYDLARIIDLTENEKSFRIIIENVRTLPNIDGDILINAILKGYSIDTISRLISNNFSIKDMHDSYKLINAAIEAGEDAEYLKELVKMGANPVSDIGSRAYDNPLRVAIENNAPDDVLALLREAGVRIDLDYPDYVLLLRNEFMKPSPSDEQLHKLMDEMAVFQGGEADLEAVLIALIECNAPLQSIRDVLRMGADINPTDFYHSPLVTAIKCNAASSVIKLLLDNDAEIEPISIFMPAYVEDVIEYDSYMDSRLEDEEGIIRDDPSYEEKYGPDEDDIESCRQAAIDRLPAMIDEEWQEIMDREDEMYSSSTALMFAIRSFSNTDVLDMLIKAGADINRKSIFYVTPLRHHADHNELSRLELTPLAVACLIDNKPAIRYLQEMDAILGDSRDEVVFCHPDDVAKELRKLYADYDLDDLLL